MAFNWNQLLDFHVHLRRAAINQELIGGDARLLEIAEELLREVELRAKIATDKTERLEKEANELEEKVDELIYKLSEAAALLSPLDGDDYRHVQDGNRLSDTDNFSALVRLLSDYE